MSNTIESKIAFIEYGHDGRPRQVYTFIRDYPRQYDLYDINFDIYGNGYIHLSGCGTYDITPEFGLGSLDEFIAKFDLSEGEVVYCPLCGGLIYDGSDSPCQHIKYSEVQDKPIFVFKSIAEFISAWKQHDGLEPVY